MKLIKARTRGLGPVVETKWFDPNPALNVFHFADAKRGARFLQALQTINPPFSCREHTPFEDFPCHISIKGHVRHISPEKRTIAIGVFGADPNLVIELGELSPLLFETDRIEVGRRQDYSRWINFVELASSSRWSEIKNDMEVLLANIEPSYQEAGQQLSELTMTLSGSDRLKGVLAEKLISSLTSLRTSLKQNVTSLPGIIDILDNIVEKVMREKFFLHARSTIYNRLPLFVMIDSDGHPSYLSTNPGHFKGIDELQSMLHDRLPATPNNKAVRMNVLEQIKASIEHGKALSETLFQSEPILLFNSPEKNIAQDELELLVALLNSTSLNHQCFYMSDDLDFLKTLSSNQVFLESELLI